MPGNRACQAQEPVSALAQKYLAKAFFEAGLVDANAELSSVLCGRLCSGAARSGKQPNMFWLAASKDAGLVIAMMYKFTLEAARHLLATRQYTVSSYHGH